MGETLVDDREDDGLTSFQKKHSDTEEKRNECGVVAQDLLNTISHRVLRTIIRHLGAIANLLQRTSFVVLLGYRKLTLSS